LTAQPTPREFLKPSAATGFIAVLLAFLGICDLTALSMSEEANEAYWGTQTPVRLAFLFGLTGYAYAFKPGGLVGSTGRGAGDHLKNSVVFAFGFVELTVWFWVRRCRGCVHRTFPLTDRRSSSRCATTGGSEPYA
jgi:hypothetical protein